MKWLIDRFNAESWDNIKWTIEQNEFIAGNDWFGNFKCGALCWDIVLRDAGNEWLLCADAYLLGVDSGYGYTKYNVPYDEGDSICLEYDINKTYEEILESIKAQLDKATAESKELAEFANKTDPVWKEDE